jgi:hypothetical protein
MSTSNEIGLVSKARLRFSPSQLMDEIKIESGTAESEDRSLAEFHSLIILGVNRELGSFGTQIEAQRDRTSILREFSNGRKAIERLEKEFQEMVKTIVRAGMDDTIPQLHFAERDNRSLETRYLNDPDLQFRLRDSVVNSRTIELPEPKLKAVCRKQLSDETHRFRESIVQRFLHLHKKKLIGEICWLENSCASLRYVSQRQETRETTATQEEIRAANRPNRPTSRIDVPPTNKEVNDKDKHPFDDDFYYYYNEDEEDRDDDDHDSPRLVGHITRTYKIFNTHDHLLTNAYSTTVATCNVDLPVQAVNIVNSFPKWLVENLRVVHGTLVKQRHIEQEVLVSEVTTTYPEPTFEEDSDIYSDPAICFGPFVLFGWVEERSEIQSDTPTDPLVVVAEAKRIAIGYGIGGLLMFLGFIAMLSKSMFLYFVFSIFGAATLAFVTFIQSHQISKTEK